MHLRRSYVICWDTVVISASDTVSGVLVMQQLAKYTRKRLLNAHLETTSLSRDSAEALRCWPLRNGARGAGAESREGVGRPFSVPSLFRAPAQPYPSLFVWPWSTIWDHRTARCEAVVDLFVVLLCRTSPALWSSCTSGTPGGRSARRATGCRTKSASTLCRWGLFWCGRRCCDVGMLSTTMMTITTTMTTTIMPMTTMKMTATANEYGDNNNNDDYDDDDGYSDDAGNSDDHNCDGGGVWGAKYRGIATMLIMIIMAMMVTLMMMVRITWPPWRRTQFLCGQVRLPKCPSFSQGSLDSYRCVPFQVRIDGFFPSDGESRV